MHTFVYSLGEDGSVELVHPPPPPRRTFYPNERARQPSDSICTVSGHFSMSSTWPNTVDALLISDAMPRFPKPIVSSDTSEVAKPKSGEFTLYHPSQTIFEQIEEEEGIPVAPELKYSRYQATFDIEVYYAAHGTNLPKSGTSSRIPPNTTSLSISVASNVLGYQEPHCFVLEDGGRQAVLQTVTTL